MAELSEPTDTPPDLCVARVPLFTALRHQDQVAVAALATPTTVAAGERIYSAGDDVSQLLVVHTGLLKISRITADGHEQIIRVLEPGEFVGESAFLNGGRPDHYVTALQPGSMCVFKHQDIGTLIGRHPSIGLRMLQGVSRRLEETEERLAAATSAEVGARLARYLIDLPAHHGPDGQVTARLPLTKKDIASLLDTTPESLSRSLRRLQESGVIRQTGPREVQVLDLDRLTALAG